MHVLCNYFSLDVLQNGVVLQGRMLSAMSLSPDLYRTGQHRTLLRVGAIQ